MERHSHDHTVHGGPVDWARHHMEAGDLQEPVPGDPLH
jgi:hypothetical protein